jgi:hypothetical protein
MKFGRLEAGGIAWRAHPDESIFRLLRVGGAVADGSFSKVGLLADAVGDFGEFALVGADGGEIIDLANQIEGAESFPDLFIAGVDGGDFGAYIYG